MALITDLYVEEQHRLHTSLAYGSRGFNWGYLIAGIAKIECCSSVLDYGCGKATLGRTLRQAGIDARDYDPGVPEFSTRPRKADLVACVDVLEHIEPDCLGEVLDHLVKLSLKVLFVAISTRPAKRFLSDGSNAHLIIKDDEWWRSHFEKRRMIVRRVWQTGVSEWVALLQKGAK